MKEKKCRKNSRKGELSEKERTEEREREKEIERKSQSKRFERDLGLVEVLLVCPSN